MAIDDPGPTSIPCFEAGCQEGRNFRGYVLLVSTGLLPTCLYHFNLSVGCAVVDREAGGGHQEFSCVTIDTESVFTSRLHELFSS